MADRPNLYTYVGNNPVNFVDPFGNKGAKGGKQYCDGDSQKACYRSMVSTGLDQERRDRVMDSRKDPPTQGGNGGGGRGSSEGGGDITKLPREMSCALGFTMMFIGMFFAGVLGIPQKVGLYASFASRAMTVWLVSGTSFAIFRNPWTLINTMFQVGLWVLWNVWWPTLSIWVKGGLLGYILGRLASNTWIANVISVVAQMGFGLLGLQAAGCF
jgi:hypothetical protein